MSKRLLSVVLVAVLTATACGRAPTSQTPGGGDRPSTAREVQGTLTLPPQASVQLGDVRVVTAYSESAISQTGQGVGNFTAVTNQGALQLLIARTAPDRLVLLGHSGATDTTEINSRTTAEALVFLNPVLFPHSVEQARNVLRILHERNILAPVQSAVEQQLATSGSISITSDPLRTALSNAYSQIYQLVRSGVFASGQRASARAATQQPQQKPSARRAAITPQEDQSGVRVTDGDDPPDDTTYNVLFLNYRRRNLVVARQTVYTDGTTSNWECPHLLRAKPSLSFGGLLTGEYFEPSGGQLSLPADPQRVSEIRVEVLGIGFRRPSPPRSAPLLCAGYAIFVDALAEVLVPTLATLLGIAGNTVQILGDPRYDSELVAAILDWGGAAFSAAPDIVEAIASGNIPSPIDMGRLLTTSIRVLVDTPAGMHLLEVMLAILARQGFTGLAAQTVARALTRLNIALLALQVAEYLYNMGELGLAWGQSRGVEKWTIIPPQSPPPFYFVATLTWSQPTDLDLYTTAPNGEISYWGNRAISVGELDYDDIDGYGPENFTLRRKRVGRYTIAVDFYRYSDQTSGHTMPSSYRVVITTRNGQQFPCRSGVLSTPGERVTACFVDLDDNGRVTVTPVTNADSVRPTDVGRDQVKPPRR
jgi:hypothetical protein